MKYNNNPHISQQDMHLCIDLITSLDIPKTRLHSHSITLKIINYSNNSVNLVYMLTGEYMIQNLKE